MGECTAAPAERTARNRWIRGNAEASRSHTRSAHPCSVRCSEGPTHYYGSPVIAAGVEVRYLRPFCAQVVVAASHGPRLRLWVALRWLSSRARHREDRRDFGHRHIRLANETARGDPSAPGCEHFYLTEEAPRGRTGPETPHPCDCRVAGEYADSSSLVLHGTGQVAPGQIRVCSCGGVQEQSTSVATQAVDCLRLGAKIEGCPATWRDSQHEVRSAALRRAWGQRRTYRIRVRCTVMDLAGKTGGPGAQQVAVQAFAGASAAEYAGLVGLCCSWTKLLVPACEAVSRPAGSLSARSGAVGGFHSYAGLPACLAIRAGRRCASATVRRL